MLPRFLLLYGAMFGAYGVAAPFLPPLLARDGLSPTAIGIVLAAGTAVRLLAGPLGGRLADRSGRAPLVLAGLSAAAAVVAFGYGAGRSFAWLLLVSVAHASLLAPMTPVADALALGSAEAVGGFSYGWVRGAGSAAFVGGTLVSGQLVGRLGLGAFVGANAALLLIAAFIAPIVPNRMAGRRDVGGDIPVAEDRVRVAPRARLGPAAPAGPSPIKTLLGVPGFGRLMLVAALVLGSHALHDGFSVIRWQAAGMSPTRISIVWSLSVVSEVAMFVLLGRPILRRIGAAQALMLSAAAGALRWGISACTAAFPVVACSECLHGLSFALLHLAVMRLLGAMVPAPLAATAQAFYATVATGAMSSLVTLASGPAYGRLGPSVFWAMTLLCVAALPIALRLRGFDPEEEVGATHR
ncbi:MFS transporter [Rhizosaccharibacter radicis]|uniref:MFS transporter n=1 Tax=Rhizosaccharibacter radicis TaxID=2782605 RepID=A0ABT1VZM8_9PROT|nr:MFS transporter [Acetobacteraceae bacterium KSS12]